jgi:hypothetical protein
VATCGPSHSDNWQWSSEALRCGAQRLQGADLQRSLAGRWVVVAGDSIARFFFAALLRLASHDREHRQLPACSRICSLTGAAACCSVFYDTVDHVTDRISCVFTAALEIVYGHRDFEYMLPNNIRATFKWAPYIANLTVLFSNWYA